MEEAATTEALWRDVMDIGTLPPDGNLFHRASSDHDILWTYPRTRNVMLLSVVFAEITAGMKIPRALTVLCKPSWHPRDLLSYSDIDAFLRSHTGVGRMGSISGNAQARRAFTTLYRIVSEPSPENIRITRLLFCSRYNHDSEMVLTAPLRELYVQRSLLPVSSSSSSSSGRDARVYEITRNGYFFSRAFTTKKQTAWVNVVHNDAALDQHCRNVNVMLRHVFPSACWQVHIVHHAPPEDQEIWCKSRLFDHVVVVDVHGDDDVASHVVDVRVSTVKSHRNGASAKNFSARLWRPDTAQWWAQLAGKVHALDDVATKKERVLTPFVVEYVTRHELLKKNTESYDKKMINKNEPRFCLVCVETRENPLAVAALYVTLTNLDRMWGDDVVVYCGERNYVYMKRNVQDDLGRAFPGRRFHVRPMQDLEHAVDEEGVHGYSRFMKSPVIWEDLGSFGSFGSYDRCLFVQDDGFIVRPGLGSELMMRWSYMGAPWLDDPVRQRILAKVTNVQLVGNGGVSVRDPRVMLRIAREGVSTKRCDSMFPTPNSATPLPEDVFFAWGGSYDGTHDTIADRDAARAFSSEQVLNETSLGFHKLWAYHDTQRVDAFFDAVLLSFDAK